MRLSTRFANEPTLSSRPRRFSHGTRIRYPIYDDRGVLLLKEGTALNSRLVHLLDRRGIRLRLTASLEVIAGPLAGREFPIPDTCTVTVGRAEGCMIRSTNPTVSAFHCVITQLPLSLHIEDKGSTNGTFVNQVPIEEPAELKDGDRIRFGDIELVVHLFASLEGSGDDVQVIAGLILDDDPPDVDPLDITPGSTVATHDPEITARLEDAWARRQRGQESP